MSKRVLCLITDGFEEIEAITPIDLLRRAEIEVVIASLNGGGVTGKCGVKIQSDASIEDCKEGDFDLLLIPGGPGVKALREDGRAADMAKQFHVAGKTIAAICAAPLVLDDANLLDGRRFTSHSSTWKDLPSAVDERVVIDEGLITSRGAGTALDFGFAIVRHLMGEQAVSDVSEAIMA